MQGDQDLITLPECNDVRGKCQLGEMLKLPFPKEKAWRASKTLELVNTDICGPSLKKHITELYVRFLEVDEIGGKIQMIDK